MEKQEREEFRKQLHELLDYSLDLMAPGVEEFFKPWEEKDPARYVEWLRNHYVQADHIHVNVGLSLMHSQHIPIQMVKTLLDFGQEELGHQKWILKDLRALGVEDPMPEDWRPHWAFSACIGHNEYRIREVGPAAYFGHAFLMEGLGAKLKIRIAAGEPLGYPKNVSLFLGSHSEINDDHADMLGETAVKHVRTRKEADDCLYSARVFAQLYSRFLNETLAGTTHLGERRPKAG